MDAIVEGLETLPGSIPEIRRYVIGRDARINDGNADLTAVADFDDVDGYLVYRDHPAHKAVISERIAPHLAAPERHPVRGRRLIVSTPSASPTTL